MPTAGSKGNCNPLQPILLRVTGEGVRTAESCVDRWQEIQRRVKEQSSASTSSRPYLSQNQSLFLFYFTFPQQTTLLLLITSSFLKSSPLLAFMTCHIPSFLLPLQLSLGSLTDFYSVRLSSFTLSSLSGGNVFIFITLLFKNIYLQPSLVQDPTPMQHLQINISESPHTQQCPKSIHPNPLPGFTI